LSLAQCKQGRSTTSFSPKPWMWAGERSVLRQFRLLSTPQASPWPYLVFFFLTSCCSSVWRQRQPASTSDALSRILGRAVPEKTHDLIFLELETATQLW